MYFKTSLNVFQELIRYLAQSGSNASGLVKALSVLSVQAQVSTYCFFYRKNEENVHSCAGRPQKT